LIAVGKVDQQIIATRFLKTQAGVFAALVGQLLDAGFGPLDRLLDQFAAQLFFGVVECLF
jgi:hypothetical protein